MHFVRSPVSQRLMKPLHVVKVKIFIEALNNMPDGLVIMEIDFLIFYRPRKLFHKKVVKSPPSAIHADIDIVLLQTSGKFIARKLRALVCIENLRNRNSQGVLQYLHSEISIQSG